jgi:two-component system CheB/CheR fusion protein
VNLLREFFMKDTRKIVALLAGVALMIALVVVSSFLAFSKIKEDADARAHTFIVINRAGDLLSELKDAETGQRGYLLTGDKAFLEPYLMVQDSVRGNLKELRQLTSISAARKHLDAIAPLMDAKLAELSQVMELRRNNNTTAVTAVVISGQGKQLMDSIRAEMSSFIRTEEVALAQHDAEFQSNMRSLFIIIVATSLLMLLLALSFVYFIYREKQQQLKNLVYLETQHLLKIQEETNKQLQQANVTLQVSEEKLAVTLNSIGDAVMATDAEGHVTLLNPLAERLTGWKLTDAVGRPVEEIFRIISEETRQPAIIPVKETLKHGTILGLANHILLIARDGSECNIDDSCAPIRNLDGQVIGAVLVFRDVTERREIENGLKKAHEELKELAAELKRVARAKSEFLANMSHELRTPLNSINGFSEVLCDEIFGPLNEKQKTYVNNVLTSGKHLLLLINQILDMAKVESGKMKLALSNLPMKSLLNEISLLVADMVSKKKIEMSLEIADDLPDIEADELKVKEVMYNLLSNAVKFTPEGGKIGMRAKKADSEIEIVVWDTGVGIARENMEKIFEGFFRVDTPYSRVTEGTGLGLPLSKKLVELHGGKFSVESEGLDRGTSVRFTLPIISKEDA